MFSIDAGISKSTEKRNIDITFFINRNLNFYINLQSNNFPRIFKTKQSEFTGQKIESVRILYVLQFAFLTVISLYPYRCIKFSFFNCSLNFVFSDLFSCAHQYVIHPLVAEHIRLYNTSLYK